MTLKRGVLSFPVATKKLPSPCETGAFALPGPGQGGVTAVPTISSTDKG